MNKKGKIIAVCAAAVLIFLVTGIITAVSLNREEETAYRETKVQYGDLTVGITESGSIEVGTTTQELKLGISAYTPETENGFRAGTMQMGLPGMGTQTAGNNQESTSDTRTLTVESIAVKEGQQVRAGDVLLTLTQESVDILREKLKDDVSQALLVLKQFNTQQKSTALSASQSYESNITYGEAAQMEYEEALEEAECSYEEAREALVEAQETLADLQQKEEKLAVQYEQELHLYDEAAYLAEYIDRKEDPYGYVKALELKENALSSKENTQDSLENVREEAADKEQEIELLMLELKAAEKNQKLSGLEAQALYDTRMLKYRNAAELYQIETQLIAEQKQAALEEYESASAKLAQLEKTISDNALLSDYTGVITQIEVSTGDCLGRGSAILTLNNYEEVNITVSVEDDDIGQIVQGDQVNIKVAAYPDSVYTGLVEEISDAQIDSNSQVTYGVTILITGDVSGLYEGMSADVTFITKETKEVLYVSNRAVYRDGADSYVLLKTEDGGKVRQEITTGFSDGINVEVLEGLEEGDIVLIESKVSDS